MNAKPADRETVTFDYGIPAELFMGKRKGGARQPLRYRRFATAAEAIRFAIEELPAVRALGAWMQVGFPWLRWWLGGGSSAALSSIIPRRWRLSPTT